MRGELLQDLAAHWCGLDGAKDIAGVTIHYLDGRVDVEIDLPVALATDPARVDGRNQAFSEALAQVPVVGSVRLKYS